MSKMFYKCTILSSLTYISKLNTTNYEDEDFIFDGCDKLVNKPIVKKKKE